MAKLSVDKALLKAKSHAKKGEVEEAKKLYQAVLQAFPKNKRAQQGLAALNKSKQPAATQGPPQDAINQLIQRYNQGQLGAAVEQAQALTQKYPNAFIIWNILGAANKGLGRVQAAFEAFKKATELNPTYADGFNNLGVTLKEQGKLDEAIASYNKALSLKPDYAEAYHNMGIALQDQGKLEEAIASYEKALSLKPDYADAYNNMGNALKDQGKLEEAIASYEKALSLKPDYADAYNNMGNALKDQGKPDEAIASFNKALSLKPDDASAYHNMGIALQDQGKLEEAIASYEKALSLKPDDASAYNNMGIALQDQGKLEEAIASYEKALSLKPDDASAYNNMGNALKDQGKLEEAIASFNKALSLKPDDASAYYNMGNALKAQGKLEEAIASYEKALSLKPDDASAYNNMGNALKDQGKLEEAIASYEKALSLKPDYAEAYYNMGNALQDQGKLEEAIASYKKALSLKPDYASAYNNMGIALQEQGKLEEAIASYEKALSLKPDDASAYNNMGIALQDQGKLEEAIASYEKALSLKPDDVAAQSQKMHQQAHICDWSSLKSDQSLIADLGVKGEVVNPFSVLSLEDAPERHRLRSVNYAKEKFPFDRIGDFKKSAQIPKRLKIGYFSADFHNHATMYLMAQIFERHDKAQFEIYAYSYGPDKQDEMRKSLIKSVDVFHDVREMSNMQIVELARSEQLDIAIDLKGFTKGTRLAPFAHGLAPVQISYLGYPGTLGADFIDYIVADLIVIPEDNRHHYSEQIIYLPHTYQPTDNKRIISNKMITREDVGLPTGGFVFSCFNNNYKISPREFDIWMRLVQKVEGSVLWLLKSNKWAEQNLKREAEARGVNADRLIFAEKLPQAEHLARQKLADLFLDTFNCNAHTTTSDALWAGLPVLTKLGNGFAARVAGSLLHAVGLPELITETEEQYEALALELAADPERLAQIKAKLAENRLTQQLFDSEQYTRHLEAGYKMAFERFLNGQAPEHIFVKV